MKNKLLELKFTLCKIFLSSKLTTYSIAAVWIVNGLFCKLLLMVPRHEQIVARILGEANSEILTKLIGIAEIFMAIWILSRVKHRMNAFIQIIIIFVMNSLEYFLAPDLLLWGRANALFAFLFISLIYYSEFRLNVYSR